MKLTIRITAATLALVSAGCSWLSGLPTRDTSSAPPPPIVATLLQAKETPVVEMAPPVLPAGEVAMTKPVALPSNLVSEPLAPVVPPTITAATLSAAAADSTAAISAIQRRQQVSQRIQAWINAWRRGDVQAYLGHYADDYKGNEASRTAWEQQRRQRLRNGIQLSIDAFELRLDGDRANVEFIQRYQAGNYRDSGRKELVLIKRESDWVIVSENWKPMH